MKTITSEADQIKALNEQEYANRQQLIDYLFRAPIPREELANNLALFMDRRILSRILFMNELYSHIVGLHGSIIEFGTRYGSNLSLFTSLRGIYEPFNHNRKVIAFDTFEGFPDVVAEDANAVQDWKKGDYGVPDQYEDFLSTILRLHEQSAPLPNIEKFELVKGDVTKTLRPFLEERQETIIALAYFDFDLYKPTKETLEQILPYLTKGAVLGFDQINAKEWPGETRALREVLGTRNFRIRHSAFRGTSGYLIFE
ncbi:MAG TPA: TylF/MycF/NovP-related O-methyltransferase [Lacibacter sp.]|mgnify:CR=1 FL=1|nr:TylF/MycF/NovP-related O-methyltransferase [Lacibacter sp.]HMO90061.1 TylF/MycF/NovP-related O-methyltransferase [Lacibacter sp.]HMP88021.1 TylF/MycF/NovP-related O-methyltransferase [Lacibacter sp.]